MQHRRAGRVVFAFAMALAVIGAISVTHIHRPLTPEALFARARHGADSGRPSGHFIGKIAITMPESDDSDASTHTMHASVYGDLQDPHHVRMLTKTSHQFEEMILRDTDLFVRAGPSSAAMHEMPFGQFSLREQGAAVGTVKAGASVLNFAAVLAKASTPVQTAHRDGRTTLSLRVDPKKVFDARVAGVVSHITASIVVSDAGKLVSLRERFSVNTAEFSLNLTFTDWGTSVEVAAPNDVDPTPTINEEAIAAYGASALYMPKKLPNGWGLAAADAIPAGDDIDCDEVLLSYTPTVDAPNSYVDMYVVPRECAGMLDGESYQIGAYRVVVSQDDDGTWLMEWTADGTTSIQVETNSPDVVDEMLENQMVPLDLGSAAATAPIADLA
jgi:hypothetical protein